MKMGACLFKKTEKYQFLEPALIHLRVSLKAKYTGKKLELLLVRDVNEVLSDIKNVKQGVRVEESGDSVVDGEW